MIQLALLISIAILVFPLLLVGKATLVIAFSFYLVVPLLILMLWKVMFSRKAGLAFATTFIFFLLFFYVAPILQLADNPRKLLNTLPVRDVQVVYVNAMVAVFLVVYTIFYFRKKRKVNNSIVTVSEDRLQSVFPLLLVGAIVVAIWGLSEINFASLVVEGGGDDQDLLTILVKHKVFFLLPFLVAAIYFTIKSGNIRLLPAFIFLAMVVLTKNPFFDRRNALGPVYLALICFVFPHLISTTRRFFLFLFIALVIAFPASSILTHHPPEKWAEVATSHILAEEITGHFTDMHYDAWANFVGSVDFVGKSGFQFGRQIAGSLLFYVPRSLWPEKPVSSGQALGEYLSQNYQLWFENISCPLPAEGYIDFGIAGVVIFAILLALYARRLDRFVSAKNTINRISSIYFVLFLFFVLRGALLPAVAYGVGAYIAMNVLPFLLSHLFPRYWVSSKKANELNENPCHLQ